MEVYFHAFLTPIRDKSLWSASRPSHLILGTHWLGVSVNAAGLNPESKRLRAPAGNWTPIPRPFNPVNQSLYSLSSELSRYGLIDPLVSWILTDYEHWYEQTSVKNDELRSLSCCLEVFNAILYVQAKYRQHCTWLRTQTQSSDLHCPLLESLFSLYKLPLS